MPVKLFEKEKCMILLSKAIYGRFATCGVDGQPYITPVNFVTYNDKIYFHTGFKGKKLDNINSNPKVCFEISSSGKMYPTPHARNFTMRFWSVLVFGEAHIVKDKELKLMVLNLLLDKHDKGYKFEHLTIEDTNIVNIVEISINEISGKASVNP